MATTLLLFLLFLVYSASFQGYSSANDSLNANQNITGNTSVLHSAGQRFVLGFFSPPGSPTESYLGIWYNQILYPGNQIVVWVANRDSPVSDPKIGVFQIADGNIVVTDTSGELYWSSGPEDSSSTNRTVKLMDSGNLILFQEYQKGKRSVLFQSFHRPTDTFLPGMKMNGELELTSWSTDNDPGWGSYIFKMANNRYVILKNQQQRQLHWENDGVNSDELTSDALNYLANFTNSPSNVSSKLVNQSSTWDWKSLYLKHKDTRILMNSTTGEIQYLKWEDTEWILLWKQPSDSCKIYNYCGNFSTCDANDWKACKCLPGFRPSNPGENPNYDGGSQGCVRKSSWNDSKDMIFLNLTMIRVRKPDINLFIETEAECQDFCLNRLDPCRAYSYNKSASDYDRSLFKCGIWTQDLTTLQVVQDRGGDLSVLVKSSDIVPTSKSCEPCGIYTIPYPLSTGPNCGDPMYSKFNCNNSTGQVMFMMHKGESYPVTWINEYARKFYIKTNGSSHCDDVNDQINKPDFPFSVTNSCFKEDEIEVSWEAAKEPPCNKSIDCNDWPHSTCKATSEAKFRCLCVSTYQWNASSLSCAKEQSRNRSIKRLPLILMVTLIGMIFLATTIFACVWRNKITRKIERVNTQIQESLYDSERRVKGLIGLGGLEEKDNQSIEVPFYTFGSILAATNNFSDSNKLGRGGYGPVYKGTFPAGQDIAVKRLSSVSTQGLEEFKNEVVLIAKLQHRNLVRLRGYCIKGDEKILLYEYMPNRSLDSFIFDRTRTLLLDWQMRFDIILGIARGLLYLHQDSRLRIIHRDLKTSNILLDDEMTPKISDFGLAKIFEGKETEAATQRIVGTYGYMAPEYALDGFFSIKSDIFSFGIVLLEILSGKRNTGFYQSKQSASLLGYAWGLWTENRLVDLMDACLRETCNESQFIKCARIGLLCVQDEPGDRPNMSNVVTMLDSEIATIPIPTQPTFYAMKRLSSNASSSSSKPETTLQFDTSYQEGR